jgi:formate dehydrogenase major subunit
MSLLKAKNMGTPPVKKVVRKATEEVSLTIDGLDVSVPKGTSIMRAARTADLTIPSLCATDIVKAFGSCRMCLVEIDGRKGTPSSCTTPAEAGMVVHTQNERLARIRRGVMELYISDHPLDCLTCSANGDCELQDMAGIVGLREVRYNEGCANHFDAENKVEVDTSNPYFQYDPSKCIVCSRCVRACDEVQGTIALTIEGRGFDSRVATGTADFFSSECVSCGACVEACPTATLMETTVVEHGLPDRTVKTTCAYCGVGCSLKAELKGDQLVRITPDEDGEANHGHTCVKGRFAWGYATHADRITKPMVRTKITDPWREVSWDEAINTAATGLKKCQDIYGVKSIGGITSSRCTNEEVWVVQKLIRAGFGNNNVDTCARVCHSPTGYGLAQTLGTSAGTQHFDSIDDVDAIVIIGANPTDAHPVFGSRLKKRIREGAKLIVIDPRQIDLVKTAHVKADYHLPLLPGTNVAMVNALAHVIITEGLEDKDYIAKRIETKPFEEWKAFIQREENSPEVVGKQAGVNPDDIRAAARLYANADNGAIYYGLGVTEHSQGSTMVMGIANLAMLTGNIGRSGVGVNPLRGQNNVQGSCDMGSFPHEFPGYRPVSNDDVRSTFEADWGVTLDGVPGFRIPNMFDEAIAGNYKGMYIQGEDIAQSDPNTKHVEAALKSMDCVVVQDLFLNETAKFAHVFLPGTSFLEKDGTFINAERRINRVRPIGPTKTGLDEWDVTCKLAQAMGYDMAYESSSEIMDEIARLTPTFTNVSFDMLDERGSVQWPCNDSAPDGTEIMHVDKFVRGLGMFKLTEYVPTEEKTNRKFPLILTTGRILSQYNVGAQTRRTENSLWMEEDVLEIHESDAEMRGVRDGDWVSIASRKGETVLKAKISERIQPGVVYTTFHHPESGTNVITTEISDWATDCPEYKVTAVQVTPSNHKSAWQKQFEDEAISLRRIAEPAE